MNNRHVDTLTETAYLKDDDDYLITEENVSADTVHEYLEKQGRNEQC